MNDAPVARFDFRSGHRRGDTLTLYPDSLVHRGGSELEAIPLNAIAAVRVTFERNANLIGWAVSLLVAALLLWLVAEPLGSVAARLADELRAQLGSDSTAARSGVPAALLGLLRLVQAIAGILPLLAALFAMAGVALGALGWFGRTTLYVSLGAAERIYRVLGRDSVLLEFCEIVGGQVVQKWR